MEAQVQDVAYLDNGSVLKAVGVSDFGQLTERRICLQKFRIVMALSGRTIHVVTDVTITSPHELPVRLPYQPGHAPCNTIFRPTAYDSNMNVEEQPARIAISTRSQAD